MYFIYKIKTLLLLLLLLLFGRGPNRVMKAAGFDANVQ